MTSRYDCDNRGVARHASKLAAAKQYLLRNLAARHASRFTRACLLGAIGYLKAARHSPGDFRSIEQANALVEQAVGAAKEPN